MLNLFVPKCFMVQISALGASLSDQCQLPHRTGPAINLWPQYGRTWSPDYCYEKPCK